MSYSSDFRCRVLEYKEKNNLTYKETASLFRVGISTLVRWGVGLEPKLTRNKQPTKIKTEALIEDVKSHPDAYQYERAQRLGVSKTGIFKALKRLKISYKKKTLSHPKENDDERKIFKEKMEAYKESGQLTVYIDESGFSNDMPRRHGYALIGQRCVGKQDWNARGRTNVIGALMGACLLTVSLFLGSINSNVFFAWITQDLLPKLPSHCVLVMDNASFHKRLDIQQAVKDSGHILEYLPAYSPDLNPIEHKWAQSKAIRKQKFCAIDELFLKYVS
jgi:transposase